MYTIYKKRLYYISGDKAKEFILSHGKLEPTNNVIDKPKDIDNLLTFRELQIKYAKVFEDTEYEEVRETKKVDEPKEEPKEIEEVPKAKSSVKSKEE